MERYTRADFVRQSSSGTQCGQCGAGLSIFSSIDGLEALLEVCCENGHRRDFRWPLGSPPPSEVMRILQK